MMHRTIPLGRIMGIPIGLDYSWFLIFILLTWSFAASYYPSEFGDWSVATYWVTGALTAIMLFVSVLIHELGHSVIAMRYKIAIRRITLFLFGGVAEIAAEPPRASAEFWIAIAGPITSFALAGLFYLSMPLTTSFSPLLGLVKYLAYINLVLALFNVIPGFPLDGGRVFRAIVWAITHSLRKATLIAANVGRSIAFLFILVGFWQIFTGNFGSGLWIAFIGWFLESAASAQVQQQMIQSLLANHRVSDAMSRNFAAIPSDISLQHLVDDHILSTGRRVFVVMRNEEVVGLLTIHRLREIPREQWSTTRVDQAMIPSAQMRQASPDMGLWECFSTMTREGVNQLPVMAPDGKLVGMLSREDVISFLHTLQEISPSK
jgi:Zn-dependent protease/CBS domain-containing protein